MSHFIVGFCETGPHWWNKFLKPGFHHCYVLKWTGKYFEKIECLTNWISTDIVLATDVIPEGHTIKEIHLDVDPLKPNDFLMVMNCVSVAKRVLGIGGYHIQTPYQLYKHLKKLGD